MDSTTIRKAIGAGRWFSANGNELANEVDHYINNAFNKLPSIQGKILGCISPHAGFRYSGQTAGYDFAALKRDSEMNGKPDVVFILGFSHSSRFDCAAVMDGKAISTPIATTEIDNEAITMFCEGRNYLKCFYKPHNGEHSAENELPFVQRALPGVKVVMVLIGTHKSEVLEQVSQGLQAVCSKKKMYVIASSDMLHDESHSLVEKTDKETIQLTEKMDIKGLLTRWSYENQIYCGITAVIPTMMYAQAIGCVKAITLDLTDSETITKRMNSGWVVGYGAVIFVI
ncbi:hypothetical protein ENUP19_0218G0038 [Entamoeba nuttalli]|uniref:Memo family protein n=2 Tax=Entamoeba nuttalli TaxID=412467 RepID=K2HUB0_ENTNP|nr:Memo family protein [Entamoeba nuttalli P19]EKE39785.1 Memo family protein [Entamoeba nuttalli P19]|eukprot:XP_008857864.1 Memo family protein [Entamoeba nuttalli P19]